MLIVSGFITVSSPQMLEGTFAVTQTWQSPFNPGCPHRRRHRRLQVFAGLGGDSSGSRKLPKRVGIIGSGPAGLSMARALQYLDTGVEEVKVFDKNGALEPDLGGGLQINGGAAVLAKLGLAEEMKRSGLPVSKIRSRTVGGRELLSIDVQNLVKNEPSLMHEGTPMVFTIMRDCLVNLLAGSLKEGTLNLGKRLTGVEEASDKSVKCKFDDGSEEIFDIVIGADGIRSNVKSLALPKCQEARYSNIRIQFGVAKGWERDSSTNGELHQWFGDGTYALSAQYKGIGEEPYEMIALVFLDTDPNTDENPNWETAAVKEACISRLRSTSNPQEVVDLASRCDRFFDLGVYYHDSLQKWVSDSGRIALIGDAAHAMPPFLGQGANQAIQDAYCLAAKLAEVKNGQGTVEEALRSYERKRKLPTTLIQLESRFLGVLETAGGKASAPSIPATDNSNGTPVPPAFVLPGFVRDAFFFATGKLGIAEQVFLKGATPKV
eukprot:CAMPEP_0184503136 /NCGR_PEP_ID=MMETSP0113_2-20130426/51709_1 /TAXON_ID=91329 /ORGANISM="Norrisiella sphaerica, Strain BC52" /LENGTH=491 /DNA_ID=CAMNT_0026892573 /DNA_START=85 /DNA_END=1560 /DNA_ORIENTATION=-